MLTEEDLAFAALAGLNMGWDDPDHPDPMQHSHLCWPPDSGRGALCSSDRLSTHNEPIGPISCEACAAQLQHLRALAREQPVIARLLEDAGKMARRIELLIEVDLAADDYLWGLDHPEDAARVRQLTQEAEGSALVRLRVALAAVFPEKGRPAAS